MATINIRNINPQVHQRIKVAAAKAGQTLKDYTLSALAAAVISSERKPATKERKEA